MSGDRGEVNSDDDADFDFKVSPFLLFLFFLPWFGGVPLCAIQACVAQMQFVDRFIDHNYLVFLILTQSERRNRRDGDSGSGGGADAKESTSTSTQSGKIVFSALFFLRTN